MPQSYINGWKCDPERRCAARNRKGQPCGNPPVAGDRFCPDHDADTPSGKARRDQRAAALRPARVIDQALHALLHETDPHRRRELQRRARAAAHGELPDTPPADSPFWSLPTDQEDGPRTDE